ncbi:unnamed protein product, partial [Owenia fusiformis]
NSSDNLCDLRYCNINHSGEYDLQLGDTNPGYDIYAIVIQDETSTSSTVMTSMVTVIATSTSGPNSTTEPVTDYFTNSTLNYMPSLSPLNNATFEAQTNTKPFDFRLATIILGAILFVALLVMVVILVLCRRQQNKGINVSDSAGGENITAIEGPATTYEDLDERNNSIVVGIKYESLENKCCDEYEDVIIPRLNKAGDTKTKTGQNQPGESNEYTDMKPLSNNTSNSNAKSIQNQSEEATEYDEVNSWLTPGNKEMKSHELPIECSGEYAEVKTTSNNTGVQSYLEVSNEYTEPKTTSINTGVQSHPEVSNEYAEVQTTSNNTKRQPEVSNEYTEPKTTSVNTGVQSHLEVSYEYAEVQTTSNNTKRQPEVSNEYTEPKTTSINTGVQSHLEVSNEYAEVQTTSNNTKSQPEVSNEYTEPKTTSINKGVQSHLEVSNEYAEVQTTSNNTKSQPEVSNEYAEVKTSSNKTRVQSHLEVSNEYADVQTTSKNTKSQPEFSNEYADVSISTNDAREISKSKDDSIQKEVISSNEYTEAEMSPNDEETSKVNIVQNQFEGAIEYDEINNLRCIRDTKDEGIQSKLEKSGEYAEVIPAPINIDCSNSNGAIHGDSANNNTYMEMSGSSRNSLNQFGDSYVHADTDLQPSNIAESDNKDMETQLGRSDEYKSPKPWIKQSKDESIQTNFEDSTQYDLPNPTWPNIIGDPLYGNIQNQMQGTNAIVCSDYEVPISVHYAPNEEYDEVKNWLS